MYRPRFLPLLGVLAGTLIAPALAAGQPDDLALVSRGYDGRPGASSTTRADSYGTAISGDGARVAFVSQAPNILAGIAGPHVYVRDLTRGVTELVDRADGPVGEVAVEADGLAAMSADGRYVTFVAQFGDAPRRVYRRDLFEGRTVLVSRADGPDGAPVTADDGALSADGRFATFTAYRQQVTADPESDWPQLYVRDLAAGRTVLVSRASGPDGETVQDIIGSATGISPGGRYVTFRATAPDLFTGPFPADATQQVWMRDLRTQRTILVSRQDGLDGPPIEHTWGGSTPVVSGGCRVAFDARGTKVASGSPTDGGMQSYLRDVCAGTTTLLSRASGDDGAAADAPLLNGPGGAVAMGSMDASGQRVTFSAAASNLAPGTSRDLLAVYVRDLATSTTTLVSKTASPSGAPLAEAAVPGYSNGLSRDGRFATFTYSGVGVLPEIEGGGSSSFGTQVFRRELNLPATAPVALPCGPLDDPGIADPPAPACAAPPAGGGDGSDAAPTPTPIPGVRTLPTPAIASVAIGAVGAPTPEVVATTPRLVRAPRLLKVSVSRGRVTAFVDLPATLSVIVERQRGRRFVRRGAPLLKVAKEGGTTRIALPRLPRARYRLTVLASGDAGTASRRVRRTLDLRKARR